MRLQHASARRSCPTASTSGASGAMATPGSACQVGGDAPTSSSVALPWRGRPALVPRVVTTRSADIVEHDRAAGTGQPAATGYRAGELALASSAATVLRRRPAMWPRRWCRLRPADGVRDPVCLAIEFGIGSRCRGRDERERLRARSRHTLETRGYRRIAIRPWERRHSRACGRLSSILCSHMPRSASSRCRAKSGASNSGDAHTRSRNDERRRASRSTSEPNAIARVA